MMTFRDVRWLMLVLMLAGCAAQVSPPSTYLLRPDPTPDRDACVDAVWLGEVTVAPYLDADGIVVETDPGVLRPARQHRWAEPLTPALKRYLQVGLREATGCQVIAQLHLSGDVATRIDILLHQLHATMAGEVRLVAEYRLGRGGEPGESLSLHEFAAVEVLSADGYAGIVEAHARLLDALAAHIAAELKTTHRHP
jgi:uncharacterized lipoprotein YmbA